MPSLDIIFIAVIAIFAIAGLRFGLIHALGSLLGVVLGIFLASRYYDLAASWLAGFLGWESNTAKIVLFVVGFLLIVRLVGIAFWFFRKILSVFTHLPLVGTVNRLLGAVFGALEGTLTLAAIVYFIERFPISEALMQKLAQSDMAAFFSNIANLLVPLLPDAFQLLKSTVDYTEGILL